MPQMSLFSGVMKGVITTSMIVMWSQLERKNKLAWMCQLRNRER